MSRALDATFETLAALLGLPGAAVCVEFTTLDIAICNSGRDITIGTKTFTGLGRNAVKLQGLGESLGPEVGSATLSIVSNDAAYQAHMITDSFRDDTATVTVVYRDGGAWVSTGWVTTFRVDQDGGNADEVQLRFRSSDAVRGLAAPRRNTRGDGCPHNYKTGLCGYRGALATCDFTLRGPNGCVVHFPDLTVTVAGVAQTLVQPKPFGGFPGKLPASLVRRG